MFQFQVDGTLGGRQNDLLDFGRPRNLINFGNVLKLIENLEKKEVDKTDLSNELIEECLTQSMTMRVPLKGMNFPE